MTDPAFVEELKTWTRFGADTAALAGDGLFVGTTGNPAIPRWLSNQMMRRFFTPKSGHERYAKQIRNSAVIAVFVSETSDKAHWAEADRCYQRLRRRPRRSVSAVVPQSFCRGRLDPAAVRIGNLRVFA